MMLAPTVSPESLNIRWESKPQKQTLHAESRSIERRQRNQSSTPEISKRILYVPGYKYVSDAEVLVSRLVHIRRCVHV
jgi:hypothetical protein